jgi:hypothetical protein
MRVHTCATSRQRRMSDNAMLGKGRAVRCRAMKQEGRAVKENITSGQSGDCLVYLGLLIYLRICARTMVCALYMTKYKWRHS